jgi:hypothetical protein
MKTKYLFIILFPLFTMWNYNSYSLSPGIKLGVEEAANPIIRPIPESIKAVEKFLIWYSKNYNKISKLNLVDNELDETTNEVYYRVNFQQTEEYLAKLKSSNYISDKYIEKWRAYFKQKDEKFNKNHQTDGPPEGFEFDFVLWTQEINGTLKAIDNIRFTKVEETENTSIVDVDIVMNLRFHLTKQGQAWKIDEIENI